VEFGTDSGTVFAAVGSKIWVRRIFPTTDSIVEYGRTVAPRCLSQVERRELSLDLVPPRWCITGPQSGEDPTMWHGKWPYDTKEWKGWLEAADDARRSQKPAPPLPSS